jgi:hypothetical protein
MIAAMIAAANRIDAAHYSYSWGGGHNPSFSGPYDCSGAVSAVLHAAGLLSRPMVSGEFMHWGAPGPGAVTIYANAGHVYMSILGRFFGTSSANPGGGAGWFDGAPRPGFVVVHVPFERLGLSKAELSRLIHGTNVAATSVRHHKKKKHRRHRRHGVIQYAPVTPGYTGQAPGAATASSGSSSSSGGSSESSGSESSSPPPSHETEQAFTPAETTTAASDEQVQAATNDTTYGTDQASSGQVASDGSSSGSGDWQSSDGSGASSGSSGASESSGATAGNGSSGAGASSSGSSGSGSQEWSGSGDSSASGSSGSGSSGSGSTGSSGSGGEAAPLSGGRRRGARSASTTTRPRATAWSAAASLPASVSR